MKKSTKRGFTIVELLVVIVVIGILAAITIVSYSGISNRAKGAKTLSNAQAVQTVAEVYNADTANNAFPATAAALTGYNGMTKLPTNITVAAATQNHPAAADGDAYIAYMPNATNTGACIAYWDFGATSGNLKYIFAGKATTADFTVATPTCS